jgi:hypothetical protein
MKRAKQARSTVTTLPRARTGRDGAIDFALKMTDAAEEVSSVVSAGLALTDSGNPDSRRYSPCPRPAKATPMTASTAIKLHFRRFDVEIERPGRARKAADAIVRVE